MTTQATPKTPPRTVTQIDISAPVLMRVRCLRKSFGGQVVLDGVSAELRKGEIVLLRGDNGSGKTTLLNILSGNLEPDTGSIHLEVNSAVEHFEFPRRWWQNLNPLDHFTPERVAREGIGRTWQDVRLFNTLTLADNTVVPNIHRGDSPAKQRYCRCVGTAEANYKAS